MHGQGKLTWEDGKTYQGEFKENMRDGFGKFAFGDGRQYEGMWANGKQHGEGRLTLEDGTEKVGSWREGAFINRRNSALTPYDIQLLDSKVSQPLSNYAQPSSFADGS